MANVRWGAKVLQGTLATTDRIPVTTDVGVSDVDKYFTPAEMKTYVETGTFTPGGTMACGANSVTGTALAFTGGTLSGMTSIAATTLTAGNINTANNTISSTDANGDITLDPNGTGDINLTTAGGYVVIPEGDLKLGTTAITATAAELNYTDGVTSKLSGLNEGVAQIRTQLSAASSTLSIGGTYNCDTSGLAAPMALTMVGIKSTKAERMLIVCNDATQDIEIAVDAADSGFMKYDGVTVYTEIVLSAAGDFVILESSAYPTGRWIIAGGKYSAT